MDRVLDHLRQHALAVVALVCSLLSLAGASYAALRLPARSVGPRQLRNHSITPVKLDPRAIGGSVRAWAKVDAQGRVISSSGRVRVQHPPTSSDYIFRWQHKFSVRCIALATVAPNEPGGSADAEIPARGTARVEAVSPQGQVGQQAAQSVSVAVIC